MSYTFPNFRSSVADITHWPQTREKVAKIVHWRPSAELMDKTKRGASVGAWGALTVLGYAYEPSFVNEGSRWLFGSIAATGLITTSVAIGLGSRALTANAIGAVVGALCTLPIGFQVLARMADHKERLYQQERLVSAPARAITAPAPQPR